ncbi:MAG: thiamine pyrophosphate-binding protein [Planctomycetes bacterium]|nr:thiamine pyrophosphate-binding protein [Planctomycetota bacterium]
MTGAELLVECLALHGVKVVFGMPGGHTASVYDALYHRPSIRHLLVRNEHAGAFMADGYARATGTPGVCLVAAGPGLANCVTGLGVAYSDSVPLLILSGQMPRAALGIPRGYYHEMDALKVTAALTRWNATVGSADDIPGHVARAFEAMTAGRPRPVHLEFPVDVLKEKTSARPQKAAPSSPAPVDVRAVEEAAECLDRARRPLILAGGGVVAAEACPALLEVAEILRAPVLTTPMGKGCIADDHPLAGGMTFNRITSDLTHMREHLSRLPELADAVLAVGCRFSQLATGNWEMPLPPDLIQIDVDEQELGRNYPVRVALHAHARRALEVLVESLRSRGADTASRDWPSILRSLPRPERWRISGLDLVPILRRVLERDAIVACDITRLYYMMLANFPTYAPRTFLHPSGFISMGYGLPGALGAKAAFPDRTVLAVAGDGGFLMTCQELACAVQERLHVVAVVVNDRCLSAMKGIQNRSFGGRHIAVDLVNPDFVKLAEAYGALGLRVHREEEFEPALRRAFSTDRPAVIEVVAPETAV